MVCLFQEPHQSEQDKNNAALQIGCWTGTVFTAETKKVSKIILKLKKSSWTSKIFRVFQVILIIQQSSIATF